MANPLADLRRDLIALVDQDSIDELKHVAGQAAKKAATDVAERDLGPDAAFSRWNRSRKVPLRAGYDLEPGTRLTLNLSPKGLWMLANDGRRAKPGRVYPKRAGRRGGAADQAKALRTPWGPRKSVKSSSSRGFGTLADAERAVERDTYKAVDTRLTQRIGEF